MPADSDAIGVQLSKIPPPLPTGKAFMFAVGQFFLPGTATIVYSLLYPPAGEPFERDFLIIGILQAALCSYLVGVLWAWIMGIMVLCKSLTAGRGDYSAPPPEARYAEGVPSETTPLAQA